MHANDTELIFCLLEALGLAERVKVDGVNRRALEGVHIKGLTIKDSNSNFPIAFDASEGVRQFVEALCG